MSTIDPQDVNPTGRNILVRKYKLPEKIGSIVIPEAWREDRSLQAFEVVAKGPRVDRLLGHRITPDDIIETYRSWPGLVPHPDLPDKYFFLDAEKVVRVHKWDKEENDE